MEEIKKLRKAVGMKQFELATLLNLEQSNYCNIENGKLILKYSEELKNKAKAILIPMMIEKIELMEKDIIELRNILYLNG